MSKLLSPTSADRSRVKSKGGLFSSLKEIWDNMFTLPPGIRTVCFVQFFAFLGWFPVLFFTSVWVSELYKSSHPDLDPEDPQVNADAVRAGARSLFFQAIVNIICSVGLPFLVSESGVQSAESEYEALGAHEPPRSALWKRAQEELASGSVFKKAIGWVKGWIEGSKHGGFSLPIKGLTTVKLWWISQYIFAVAMMSTWCVSLTGSQTKSRFITSVSAAYAMIGVTGISWALCQCASPSRS